MNILFLTQSYNTMNFFRQIALTLMDEGHKVRCLSLCDVPAKKTADPWDYHEADWAGFDWKYIDAFRPDRIIIFNGMFRELHAAAQLLKMMYPTFFAEVAWFPQKDYIYLDREIHHMGNIANFNMREEVDFTDNHKRLLVELRGKYVTREQVVGDDFDILVPMQLEYDTSILYASETFKSMKSLVGFAKHTSKGARVIVKTHPKNNNNEPLYKYMFTPKNATLVQKFEEMGVEVVQDVSVYNLMTRARLIVGINSTSLMEALIYHKPILQLGDNIAFHEGEGCMLDVHHYLGDKHPVHAALEDVKAGTAVGYDPEKMDRTLLHMLANQIDFRNPPRWAIDKILEDETLCRTMKDIA